MTGTRLVLNAGAPALAARFVALRTELGVPETFPDDVLAEAEAAADRGPDDERLGVAGERADLRDVPFVTVDPPGSTDLDQAVHLERRPGGGYRVRYAIADVAAFVRPGGAIDAEAHARGQTVYCPDRRIALHPPVLSEGAASLLPDGDRPAVVWTIDLDDAGEVVTADVRRGTVRSTARLDYAAVQAALDAAGPGDRDTLPVLLAEVGTARAAVERSRGVCRCRVPSRRSCRAVTASRWSTARRSRSRSTTRRSRCSPGRWPRP
ncbi:RNB domain-containing ribonuclease [Cellulomonas sp. ATA003]|uniref:RNB domain-containing ribonuclease n=1 Tax=Cellulomonas sp. ATA003 TaxID=3073064 RepID=UPI00287337B2|nr:RNB domain-containing ribonuclease [Cellulomonas sp. ATA003]WNB84320.1 RNB domain-containing ribonuclease [Cellulomonas sp. ATA003]